MSPLRSLVFCIIVSQSTALHLRTKSTALRLWTNVTCKDWCTADDHVDHVQWADKCTWDSCGICDPCATLNEDVSCGDHCYAEKWDNIPWSKKCFSPDFGGCKGCDECEDPDMTTCANWCSTSPKPKDEVCTWGACSTCECCSDGSSTCTVSEDPHIEVFDGQFISLAAGNASGSMLTLSNLGAGDQWLVKSSLVSIQARYMPNDDLPDRNLFLRAVAVGGEFLKGNTIVIGSLEDNATWNGLPILGDDRSQFSLYENGFFVDAVRSEHSSLVQDLTKENHGVNIDLPLDVKLVVNRLHNHINIAIKMPPVEGGQEGLCGNFNGFASDDSLEMEVGRFDPRVSPEDVLFVDPIF